jgi:hypothetical protein
LELYLYFVCRSDGIAISLDAHEFPGDAPAIRHAETLLAAHTSCDQVVVRCGERLVETRRRAPRSLSTSTQPSPRLVIKPEILRFKTADGG